MLIEVTVEQMCLGPGAQFESAILEECRDIDSPSHQPLQILATVFGIDCVYDFFTAFEAILNKRKQHTVLFLAVVKKSADMASIAEWRASEQNGPPALIRVFLGELSLVVKPIHRGLAFRL